MKKIVGIIAAISMAASVFAADIAATVKLSGSIMSGNKDGAFNLVGLDDNSWRWGKDLFNFSFDGDKGGAFVTFGTPDDPTAQGTIKIGAVRLWFQPIDMLKVTVGNLPGDKIFCEHTNWWRTPYGYGKLNDFVGISAELKPIADLTVYAALKTGWGANFMAAKEFGYQDWSLAAKYTLGDLNLAIGGGFYDKGYNNAKIINIGASYGNEWGGPFFGFLSLYVVSGKNFEFKDGSRIIIDDWFKFKLDPVTLTVRVPVGIYIDDSKVIDLDWEIKGTIPVDPVEVYLILGNKNDGELSTGGSWNLADLKFDMRVNPGVTFKIGIVEMDVGAKFIFGEDLFDWSIPFSAAVKF